MRAGSPVALRGQGTGVPSTSTPRRAASAEHASPSVDGRSRQHATLLLFLLLVLVPACAGLAQREAMIPAPDAAAESSPRDLTRSAPVHLGEVRCSGGQSYLGSYNFSGISAREFAAALERSLAAAGLSLEGGADSAGLEVELSTLEFNRMKTGATLEVHYRLSNPEEETPLLDRTLRTTGQGLRRKNAGLRLRTAIEDAARQNLLLLIGELEALQASR